MYPYIAPESFDNSNICSLTNEQLSIKISDLLEQKEINKFVQDKDKLISLIKKYCEFFKLSEDNETVQYELPDEMNAFSILNIPTKMNKEEVKNSLELINLNYNRLYKRGFYWIISTTDKETVICVQNSLRELIFDEMRVRYIHLNKNQIMKVMRDKTDKNSYQKEAKYLGINSKSNYSKNYYNKSKNSDADSDAFSWRKGSGGTKSSFDYSEKPYKKNAYNKYKRNRFNSDNNDKKKRYYNNNNNYYNYNYKDYNSNSSNNSNNQEIEIDISNLKYSLSIKHKYSFKDIKNVYKNLEQKKEFSERPVFLDEEKVDIYRDKPKELVALDELIECNEKNKKTDSSNKKVEDDKNQINTNVKIPKMNPLSGMSKNFNKFDIVPGNGLNEMMKAFPPTDDIQESNKDK